MTTCTGAGVYDFSGTAPSPIYAQQGVECSPDDVASWTKTWWDGASSGWTSDEEYAELAKSGHKLKGAGLSMMLMGRNAFGDGDCQHIITARKGKKGCVVAHADFTSVCGFFDEEANFPAGPVPRRSRVLLRATRSRATKRSARSPSIAMY